MIDGLRPYPEMKASGLPWLGDVPAHWDMLRSKRLLKAVELPVRHGDDIVTCFRDGQVTLRRNRRSSGFMIALLEQGYQGVRAGQLVVHSMDAFAGAIGISDSDGKCTPEYIVCKPRSDSAVLGYYSWVLRQAARTGYILASCSAVRERAPRLRYPDLGELRVPVPSADEQRLIVRFLDWHVEQTAKLVRAKKKVIALLNEQKQAIIHRAVTRGLDPSAKLKPSGIPWLGDVPEGWEVKRLKWATRLQRGYDLPADRRIEGPYPVVSSGGVIDHHLEYKVRAPGVVIGRYGSTDAVFYIEEDFWPHNTSLFVTDFQRNLPRWCYYLLGTISKADHAGKSAVPGVDRKDLFDIVVPVPPYEEQIEVVRGIEDRSRKLNSTISKVENEISLIQEFRTRLIADVVTGKLDVRAAAASLPGVTDIEPIDDLTEGDDLDETVDDAEIGEVAA